MALYTAESVRANIRNREGRRVFYLREDDRLTPGASDYLREHGIAVLPAAEARGGGYRTLRGAVFSEKPEDMTHLNAQFLVPKTHPRIAFRGSMDALQADLLLAQKTAEFEGFGAISDALGDALTLTGKIIAADVLEEPLAELLLDGMNDAELRARSHNPQKYYDQPHFMPDKNCNWTLLLTNKCRTAARQAELTFCRAFSDTEGRCARDDILRGLNRLSSFLWILEIRLASGKERNRGRT